METLVVHPTNIEQQDLLEAIFKEMRVPFDKEKPAGHLAEWQEEELKIRSKATANDFICADLADEMADECFN